MFCPLRVIFVVVLSVVGLQQAIAHPHVWIAAKTGLVLNDENALVAIRHQWQFDEAFAAYATVGLDKNGDGRFSRAELAKLARINVESIADFHYFTFVQMGDIRPEYDAGTDYWLEYENGRLTLYYTLPLAQPIKPDPITRFKDLTIEVFDPAFFANVEFAGDNPVKIYASGDSESRCVANVAHPRQLDPLQRQLLADVGPAQDIPDDLSPDVSFLANVITVSCSPA